jgi:hypothetical protein
MRLWRSAVPAALLVLAVACKKAEQPAETAAQPAGPAPGTPEWKIQNAMSAAPGGITAAATIMDWPSTPTGQPTQLRAGTNGWTCFPDTPSTPANDPMCLDQQWMTWAAGYMAHKPPNVTAVGYSYMLMGSSDASNTDPFKEKPDSGQSWQIDGPHIMVVYPRSQMAMLNALPDTQSAGPYVMWKGTPYAHVMVPVGGGGSGRMAGM